MLKSFLVAEFAASWSWQIHYFGFEEMAQSSGTASGRSSLTERGFPAFNPCGGLWHGLYGGVSHRERDGPKEFEMDITPKESLHSSA
jgi:hypothetical protein